MKQDLTLTKNVIPQLETLLFNTEEEGWSPATVQHDYMGVHILIHWTQGDDMRVTLKEGGGWPTKSYPPCLESIKRLSGKEIPADLLVEGILCISRKEYDKQLSKLSFSTFEYVNTPVVADVVNSLIDLNSPKLKCYIAKIQRITPEVIGTSHPSELVDILQNFGIKKVVPYRTLTNKALLKDAMSEFLMGNWDLGITTYRCVIHKHDGQRIYVPALDNSVARVLLDIKWITNAHGILKPHGLIDTLYRNKLTNDSVSLSPFIMQDQLHVRVGDLLKIYKKGHEVYSTDVIEAGTYNIHRKPPTVCTSCGRKLVDTYYCLGRYSCGAQRNHLFYGYINALEFIDMSKIDKTIKHITNSSVINTPADIYRLTHESLLGIPKITNTEINVIRSIQTAKDISLNQFIASLRVSRLKIPAIVSIARYCKTLEGLMALTMVDLKGVPEKGIKGLIRVLNDVETINYLNELLAVGVTIHDDEGGSCGNTLK